VAAKGASPVQGRSDAQPSAPWLVIAFVAAGATALALFASHATGIVALRRRLLDGLTVPE
jgi:hypothetical protein